MTVTHLRLATHHATAACAALIPAAAGGRDSHGGKLDVEAATRSAEAHLLLALQALVQSRGQCSTTNQSPKGRG